MTEHWQQHWKEYPQVDNQTGTEWHRLPDTDIYEAFIFGTAHDDQKYARAVEATQEQIQDGKAGTKLVHSLLAILIKGPSICVAIKDGGNLPREREHRPLQSIIEEIQIEAMDYA